MLWRILNKQCYERIPSGSYQTRSLRRNPQKGFILANNDVKETIFCYLFNFDQIFTYLQTPLSIYYLTKAVTRAPIESFLLNYYILFDFSSSPNQGKDARIHPSSSVFESYTAHLHFAISNCKWEKQGRIFVVRSTAPRCDLTSTAFKCGMHGPAIPDL